MNSQEIRDDYSHELEEVWALFAEDGREALDLVEETLLELESDPTDAEQVSKLFRGLHTFKGNARIMGLSVIESLAHHAEDLVALVRDEGVALTGAMIDLLLEILDRSRVMLNQALAHRRDADATQVEELMARLKAMLAEHSKPAPSSPDTSLESVDKSTEDLADETFLPIAAEEPVLSTPVPGIVEGAKEPILVEETIDPATDPLYVQIFLEMAEEELSRLHIALDALAGGDGEGIQEIKAVAGTLMHAAGRMGYERLVAVLEDLVTTVEEPDGKARVARLNELEQALSEELSAIQGADRAARSEDGAAVYDVARPFRHWCTEGVLADLLRLDEVTDDLEQIVKQLLAGGSPLAWDEKLADEAAYLLRAIYQACVFYKLDRAAHLTLALGDLYARVAQGEMTVNEALLNLTRAYATHLRAAIEAVREGKTPELAALVDLLGQTEEMLCLHTESQVSQVTKDMLALLDLPPEFEEVMMPESLLEVSRALQAGESLYTVLADLNRHDEIGQAFYEWSQSNAVRLITNVTVYRDNRSLFNFLLTTSESQETVLEAFARMDPRGRHLSLKKCTLREGVDLGKVVGDQAVQETVRSAERVVETRSVFTMEALANFVKSVGELAAARATLHRVTQRLTEVDLLETVTRLVRQSDGDWQHTRKELQTSLESWADDLCILSQVETEMGVALGQFQETALALRARPAAEILDPLQRLVQDVAQHQGKVVELEVAGADIGLDHDALDVLADPVRRLVWFATAHSIEKPVQRREAGKPATGRVSVVVRKAADHVQVVVEDDGCGIDREAVLNHARELGWMNGDSVAAGRLSKWVLRDGFGVVGGSGDIEGIDLAAISAELQVHQGRLSMTSEPGRGTRFSLELPLDMVVIDGIVMRVGDVHYVVSVEAVRRIVKPEETQIVHSSADGSQRMLRLGEELVPIQTLTGNGGGNVSQEGLLLVVERDEQDVALAVDELIGQQQVLIQPLRGYLTDIQSVSRCALLGEGDVGIVLDLSQV